MTKVVIIGAGITGLAVNYVLSGVKGIDTTLISRTVREAGSLEFNTGPLRRSGISSHLLEAVRNSEIPYSEYNIRNGVLLNGWLEKMQKVDEGSLRQEDIAAFAGKTRRSGYIPRLQLSRVFSDIEFSIATNGIQTDWEGFSSMLLGFASPIQQATLATINTVDKDICVQRPDGSHECIDYDHLVLTIPRWEMKGLGLDQNVTHWTKAMEKSIVTVRCDTQRFFDYDCTYLFDTSSLYRMTSNNGLFTFEASGCPDQDVVIDDLNGILKDEDYQIESIQDHVKGYMLHSTARLGYTPPLPDDVTLMGPYAEWQPHKDLSTIMTDAAYLGEKLCL